MAVQKKIGTQAGARKGAFYEVSSIMEFTPFFDPIEPEFFLSAGYAAKLIFSCRHQRGVETDEDLSYFMT